MSDEQQQFTYGDDDDFGEDPDDLDDDDFDLCPECGDDLVCIGGVCQCQNSECLWMDVPR